MNYIQEYFSEIQKGNIVVSNKVYKVYKHLTDCINDGYKNYIYDNDLALYYIDFIECFCKQSKGSLGGKALKLELWQKAMISAIFGFIDKDTGYRRFREVIFMVARKNGKSTLASAIGLAMLLVDGEAGPEVYSVATKQAQSKLIWDESVAMIKKSPALKKRLKCLVSTIKCSFNDGKYVPLSSESGKLDGLNVSCALIDELHAFKDPNLYKVVVDGASARTQPLMLITTTAGFVREGIFDIKYDQAKAVLNGYEDADGFQSDTVLPIIYELDARKEWTNPKAWQKANPGLGTIKKISALEEKVKEAKQDSRNLKNLLVKDFNVKETESDAYLTFEQLNNTATFDINSGFKYAIGGIDLSTTTDLTCATILMKQYEGDGTFFVHQMYWIPEELFEKRINEDKVPYDVWYKNGWIRKSPGNTIDYHLIVEWFIEMQEKYDIYIYKVGYDSWSARYFVDDMKSYFGNVMEAVIQGKKTLSGPMKLLSAKLDAKQINYNNNPVLKWCMANVSVLTDVNGNIQPCKLQNPKQRIDGFASMLDAFVIYENYKDDYEAII